MKKILFFTIAITLIANFKLFSQRVFYNNKDEIVNSIDSCNYFEVTYFDTSDSKKKTVEIYSKYENLLKIVPFYDNQIDGTIITFDSIGNVKNEESYVYGIRNGYQFKYWANKRIRRQELFIDNIFSSGKCFDTAGKEVPYIPANRDLKVKNYKSIDDYIFHNIQNVQAKNKTFIEGRTIVSFTISKLGIIENITIEKSISKDMDKAIFKLISEIKIESPEIVDDEPICSYEYLPLTFREE